VRSTALTGPAGPGDGGDIRDGETVVVVGTGTGRRMSAVIGRLLFGQAAAQIVPVDQPCGPL